MKYKAITGMKVNVPYILLLNIIVLKILLLVPLFCILSDDFDHDASLVHNVMEATARHVKAAKKIHYFSYDCAGQYKNGIGATVKRLTASENKFWTCPDC